MKNWRLISNSLSISYLISWIKVLSVKQMVHFDFPLILFFEIKINFLERITCMFFTVFAIHMHVFIIWKNCIFELIFSVFFFFFFALHTISIHLVFIFCFVLCFQTRSYWIVSLKPKIRLTASIKLIRRSFGWIRKL